MSELCLMFNAIERIEKLDGLTSLRNLNRRANRIAAGIALSAGRKNKTAYSRTMGKGDGGEDGVKAKARKGRDKSRRTYELNGKNSAKHVRLRVAQTSNVQACSWQCAAFMHRHVNRPLLPCTGTTRDAVNFWQSDQQAGEMTALNNGYYTTRSSLLHLLA